MSTTKQEPRIIVVYGSLKKGRYNHGLLKDQKFLGKTTVRGIMQLNYGYPHLFDPKEVNAKAHNHEAEVYEASYNVFRAIDGMELGAGYRQQPIPTQWGEGIMYYTLPELFSEGREVVEEY